MQSVIDIEIYPNYFLFAAKDLQTEIVTTIETNTRLNDKQRVSLNNYMADRETIGFNTIHFDLVIIYAAIAGKPVSKLKEIADRIIVYGMSSWDVRREYGINIPKGLKHIDLFEVAPGKMVSLKTYAGRINCKRLQDLPYKPSLELSSEEQDKVKDYCVNGDLVATAELFKVLDEQISLRRDMSKQYKISLLSKSNPQIAEAVLVKEVQHVLKTDISKIDPASVRPFHYKCPKFISFESKELNELVDKLEEHLFVIGGNRKIELPEFLRNSPVVIDDQLYSMGIGGLHSNESCRTIVAKDDYVLEDHDVTSYYPNLIINMGLAPQNMGWAFTPIYKSLVDKRITAKRAAKASNDPEESEHYNQQAKTLKIVINGSFGKFGDPYSYLFSPNLLIQTTLTGQLALFMLIEELTNCDIKVVSANTDGIVLYYHKSNKKLVDDIIDWWEKKTGLQTEATSYNAILSMNVNSYLAFEPDGTVKAKGILNLGDLTLNPASEISVRAVVEYIQHGTPLMDTIVGCRDFSKFLTVRKANSGATYDGKYLGKTIRWYHSLNSVDCLRLATPTKSGLFSKVPDSEQGMPAMELPDEFPDDIDYKWYFDRATDILYKTGYFEDLNEKVKGMMRAFTRKRTELRKAAKDARSS